MSMKIYTNCKKIKSENLHNLIGFKIETFKMLLPLVKVNFHTEILNKHVFDFLCRLVFNLKILNCNYLICSEGC